VFCVCVCVLCLFIIHYMNSPLTSFPRRSIPSFLRSSSYSAFVVVLRFASGSGFGFRYTGLAVFSTGFSMFSTGSAV
jgi:hypothetical protein